MLENLEAYLISREIFWPLGDSVAGRLLPRMTFGNLLLTIDQLTAQNPAMTSAQSTSFQRHTRYFDQFRTRRPAAIEKKALQEAGARLNLWKAYVADLREGQASGEHYAHEVRNRVMLARLSELSGSSQEYEDYLASAAPIDAALRALFAPGEFCWDGRLEAIYPPSTFWFLYGSPAARAI